MSNPVFFVLQSKVTALHKIYNPAKSKCHFTRAVSFHPIRKAWVTWCAVFIWTSNRKGYFCSHPLLLLQLHPLRFDFPRPEIATQRVNVSNSQNKWKATRQFCFQRCYNSFFLSFVKVGDCLGWSTPSHKTSWACLDHFWFSLSCVIQTTQLLYAMFRHTLASFQFKHSFSSLPTVSHSPSAMLDICPRIEAVGRIGRNTTLYFVVSEKGGL